MTGEDVPRGRADGEPTVEVELHARSSLPAAAAERRDQVIGRLQRIAQGEHVAGATIHTWERKVPVDRGSAALERYRAFASWADGAGASLDPFFGTRACYSMGTGERGEWLVLPVLCLAVYGDDGLRAVYPHATDDGSRSVVDGLSVLAAGTPDADALRATD